MFSEAASTLGIRPAIIEKDFARRSPALVGNARLFSDKRVIRFPDRDFRPTTRSEDAFRPIVRMARHTPQSRAASDANIHLA